MQMWKLGEACILTDGNQWNAVEDCSSSIFSTELLSCSLLYLSTCSLAPKRSYVSSIVPNGFDKLMSTNVTYLKARLMCWCVTDQQSFQLLKIICSSRYYGKTSLCFFLISVLFINAMRADVNGSDIPSFRILLVVEERMRLVDVFSTDWRQEGHPATRHTIETLNQLPLMERTFPLLLFLHCHPFFCLRGTRWRC